VLKESTELHADSGVDLNCHNSKSGISSVNNISENVLMISRRLF